jgi:hypothetical protein
MIIVGVDIMESRIVEMDVREDLLNKQEPFQKIMMAISDFNAKDTFLLHAPFEPVPLYTVLKARGFEYQAEKIEENYWKITFIKN